MSARWRVLANGELLSDRLNRKDNLEIWKDIAGFEGCYEVSNYGRVRSKDRDMVYINGNVCHYKGRDIAPFTKSNGYLQVTLWRNCEKIHKYVHRLVAEAFIHNPDPSAKIEVNHIDEDKTNNHADNLEWCTDSENKRHGTAIERANKRRKEIHCSEKSVIQYTLNWEPICTYHSMKEAAEASGMDRASIYNACHGLVKPLKYNWQYA